MRFHHTIAALLALAWLGPLAEAKEPKEPIHGRKPTPAGTADYALATFGAGMLLTETIVLQTHQAPLRWKDPILFDEDVRKALRIDDQGTRDAVGYVSWTLMFAQMGYPVFIDIPYAWARYGRGVAWDLFWQDAVTQTLAGAFDFAIRDLTGRARPSTWECLERNGQGCTIGPEPMRSFPGGHIINSTAASVLTCTQHLYARLYGGPWDAVTCAATLTSNTAVAVMRIANDSHWATDQLTGMAIGAAIGWGIPWLMHFRKGTIGGDAGTKPPSVFVLPAPIAVERGMGFGAVGIF